MSVTNARWIGTKEDATGAMVPYCTRCGADGWSIGDIHHTPYCLVPLVTKQAAIIVGFTEQVGELKAALAASEQRVGEAEEALIEAATNTGYAYYTRAMEAEARAEAMRGLLREAYDDVPTAEALGSYPDVDGWFCPRCDPDVERRDLSPEAIRHAPTCLISRIEAALGVTPPHPEPPTALPPTSGDDDDEYELDPAKVWQYDTRLGRAVPPNAPPAAAPSVPDAAGVE